MVPANEGNDKAPGLGHGNDRRIRAFMFQVRRDGANQDAGRADTDDRAAAAEQIGDMRPCLAEMMRRLGATHGMTVNIGIKCLCQLAGKRKPGRRQA